MGLPFEVYGAGGHGRLYIGGFYLKVVQAAILFGLEMQVVYPRIGRLSGKFYHRLIH